MKKRIFHSSFILFLPAALRQHGTEKTPEPNGRTEEYRPLPVRKAGSLGFFPGPCIQSLQGFAARFDLPVLYQEGKVADQFPFPFKGSDLMLGTLMVDLLYRSFGAAGARPFPAVGPGPVFFRQVNYVSHLRKLPPAAYLPGNISPAAHVPFVPAKKQSPEGYAVRTADIRTAASKAVAMSPEVLSFYI